MAKTREVTKNARERKRLKKLGKFPFPLPRKKTGTVMMPKKLWPKFKARIAQHLDDELRGRQLDFIGQVTGKERGWWVAFIQGRITARSKPSKDPLHDQSDSQQVINDVVGEIRKLIYAKAKKEKRVFDGNMALAAATSYVLAVWYLRLHRAKSYDPRRPVKHRQIAYWQRHAFARAMFDAIVDESMDAKFFPGQRWESPFDPYPTDGYFV